MKEEVQKFLEEEILHHAITHGFAFYLEERELLKKSQERFGLSHSEALWQMTLFIQDNAGPEGDLAVVDINGTRYFQWRFVEWPSWLPDYVKKPKWLKKGDRDKYLHLEY